MILCDRCKDVKKAYVQKYKVFNLRLYEHNNFEIPKDLTKEGCTPVGEIDLCEACASILQRKIINAVFGTRKGE